MPEYIQKGGPLMWLIVLCSVLVITVFLERLTYFHRASIRVGEFLRGLSNLIQRRNFAEALHECAGAPGPVARVIHAAIIHHEKSRSDLKEIVQEAGQLEVPKLERNLALLSTITFVTPLIGLLGTLTGLIDSFGNIESHSDTSSMDISSGIHHSLLTAAASLAVAIPSSIAYSYLSARVNTLLHDMERGGIEIVNLIIASRETEKRGAQIIDFQQQKAETER